MYATHGPFLRTVARRGWFFVGGDVGRCSFDARARKGRETVIQPVKQRCALPSVLKSYETGDAGKGLAEGIRKGWDGQGTL